MARNDSWSVLGVVGSVAAYEHGDAWLDSLLVRIADQDGRSLTEAALRVVTERARPRG